MWHVTKRALLGDFERDEGVSRIDSAGDEGVSRIGTAGDLGRDAHSFTGDLDRDAARFTVGGSLLPSSGAFKGGPAFIPRPGSPDRGPLQLRR
jgi:hypothetical protein